MKEPVWISSKLLVRTKLSSDLKSWKLEYWQIQGCTKTWKIRSLKWPTMENWVKQGNWRPNLAKKLRLDQIRLEAWWLGLFQVRKIQVEPGSGTLVLVILVQEPKTAGRVENWVYLPAYIQFWVVVFSPLLAVIILPPQREVLWLGHQRLVAKTETTKMLSILLRGKKTARLMENLGSLLTLPQLRTMVVSLLVAALISPVATRRSRQWRLEVKG